VSARRKTFTRVGFPDAEMSSGEMARTHVLGIDHSEGGGIAVFRVHDKCRGDVSPGRPLCDILTSA
jgi:hypothetical protein